MKTFDYSTPTSYFITICTCEKQCLFGQPLQLNPYGEAAKAEIESMKNMRPGLHIDHYAVMPNHVHFLLSVHYDEIPDGTPLPNVSGIIGCYKAGVARSIHQHNPNIRIWQRSFHDHVVRNEQEWQKIWQYIDDNPQKWEEDCFYTL